MYFQVVLYAHDCSWYIFYFTSPFIYSPLSLFPSVYYHELGERKERREDEMEEEWNDEDEEDTVLVVSDVSLVH